MPAHKKLCEPAALSRCMQLRTRYVGEERLQRYPCTEGLQNRAPGAGHVGDVDICFLIRTDGAASTRRDWPGSLTRDVGRRYPCTSVLMKPHRGPLHAPIDPAISSRHREVQFKLV